MKNIVYSFLFLMGVITFGACKNYVDDVNNNPNVAVDAPIETLINAAMVGTILGQEGEDARLGCIWSQQFTGSDRQYSSIDIYTISSGNFTWDKYYIAAQNAKIANDKATSEGLKSVAAVAKIIRAVNLGTVVAGWGDAPVSEANDLFAFPNPNYDKQAVAYTNLIAMLDAAIADLNGVVTVPKIKDADFIYAANAAKWAKLAHSLKARYLLHTKKYAEAITAAKLGIVDNTDAFIAPHGTSQGQNMNIYYDFIKVNREGYMTAQNAFLPNLLQGSKNNAKTDEKARFAAIYKGTAPEYDLNEKGMWAQGAPFVMFGAEETNLIIAECENRLGNSSNALVALNTTRGILKNKFSGSKYDDYEMKDFEETGMLGSTGKSATETMLLEIIREKYCSLVGQHEVFNDIKRTKNLIGITPKGSKLPQRFLYPEVEINANENLPRPLPTLYDPTPVNQ